MGRKLRCEVANPNLCYLAKNGPATEFCSRWSLPPPFSCVCSRAPSSHPTTSIFQGHYRPPTPTNPIHPIFSSALTKTDPGRIPGGDQFRNTNSPDNGVRNREIDPLTRERVSTGLEISSRDDFKTASDVMPPHNHTPKHVLSTINL